MWTAAPTCPDCGAELTDHWHLFAHAPVCETAQQWEREDPKLVRLKAKLGEVTAKVYHVPRYRWRPGLGSEPIKGGS